MVIAYLIDNKIEIADINFDTLADTVAILTSLLLFAASILIYQKFNGSQSIVDKQTDRVIALLNFITAIDFSVTVYDNGNETAAYFNINATNYYKRRNTLTKKDGESALDLVNGCNHTVLSVYYRFKDFAANPYMPATIAKCVKESFELLEAKTLDTKINSFVGIACRGPFDVEEPTLDGYLMILFIS